MSGRGRCAVATAELQWIKRNKRLIAHDREVPRCTYVFEVIANATL